MGNIFRIFILILITIPSYGQRVILDKMENDSLRILETERIVKRKFTDTVIWNYGIKTYHTSNETLYLLMINLNSATPIRIKEKCLIKLFNEETIELKTLQTFYNDVTVGYRVKHLVNNIHVINRNTVTQNIGVFVITEEYLEKLQNGIKKIRLETYSSYVEKKYKDKEVGKRLYESYLNIKNEINIKEGTRIYDGF